MLNVFLLMMSLLLIASCSSGSSTKNKQSTLYFNAGTQSLMDKDYTAALTSLLKANAMDPENSDILTNLGMAYFFKGEKESGIRYLKEALKFNENNSDAKVNLASIYFLDKNYNEAERLYIEVTKDLTYDKQARNYYNLGLVEMQAYKNLTKAEDYFKRSVKEDENYCPSYFQLGHIRYTRRQFNTALKFFREAGMGTCSESPAPHYYQGLTLIELGKFDDARMKLDEVESRFKKSTYAVKARSKAIELQSIEIKEAKQVSSKTSETPEF